MAYVRMILLFCVHLVSSPALMAGEELADRALMLDGIRLEDIFKAKDGTYLVAGWTVEDGIYGAEKAVLAHIDSQGKEILWLKTLDLPGPANGWSLKQDPEGRVFLSGFTNVAETGWDIFFAILNPDKKYEIKTRILALPGDQRAWDMELTYNGNIILFGEGVPEGRKDKDMFALFVNEAGEILWQKNFGNPEQVERGYGLDKTADGVFVAVGTTERNDLRFPFVVSFDATGAVLWETEISNIGDVIGHDILFSNNEVLMLGYGKGMDRDVSDIHLVKLNSDGQVLEHKVFRTEQNDRGITFTVCPDGRFITAGYSQGESDGGDWNGYILELDNNLNLINHRFIGGPTRPEAVKRIACFESGYAAAGYQITGGPTGSQGFVLVEKTEHKRSGFE